MSKTARQAEHANCEECSGTGWRDSGGSHPWGDAVYIPCDMCEPPASVERICFEVHPIAERVSAADELVTAVPDGCGRCHTCAPNKIGGPMRMIVCPECGNKRCPKANDCRNACTGSNEPGQAGSAYPAAPTITERQCCGSLATGPHKMGCDYKLVATESTNEINGLRQKQAVSGSSGGRQIKPCRCGPDMCADSVACPRL